MGWDIATSSVDLAEATMMAGDLTGARSLYLKGLRLAREVKSTPLMLIALMGVAQLDVRCGEFEPAVTLAELVLNHPTSMHETRQRAGRLLQGVKPRFEAEPGRAVAMGEGSRSLDSVLDALPSGTAW